MKTRLQHYLSREEAILDANPEIGSAQLCRLGLLNHRAGDVLRLFKNTSQSPRWNALKKVYGGRSSQGAIQQKLTLLSAKVQDSQRAAIMQCFQDKINPDDQAVSLSWLRQDYGLDQCHDEKKLNDFLDHLMQIGEKLSFVDMQKHCRKFSLMIVDEKSFNPKS